MATALAHVRIAQCQAADVSNVILSIRWEESYFALAMTEMDYFNMSAKSSNTCRQFLHYETISMKHDCQSNTSYVPGNQIRWRNKHL